MTQEYKERATNRRAQKEEELSRLVKQNTIMSLTNPLGSTTDETRSACYLKITV
jgi:hypothetical protein